MRENKNIANPFEYAGATNLSPEEVDAIFVSDYNYSKFIQSTRNVFLFGERGSGKSMTLKYNSLQVQHLKRGRDALSNIGVFINCNTPLFHREEYNIIEENNSKSAVISEHIFVLWVAQGIVETLSKCNSIDSVKNNATLRDSISYILDIDIPIDVDVFEGLRRLFSRESVRAQNNLNRGDWDFSNRVFHTFSSLIVPLLNELRNVNELANSHFSLMIDDAQYLNKYQAKALNSWISYRDHTMFSFKVAVAKNEHATFVTSGGSAILEGHDFIQIDLEEPFQNKESPFGKLARSIVEKRLAHVGIHSSAEDFFKVGVDFQRGIDDASERIRARFLKANPEASPKQVADYVYKYGRVEFFRNRASRANLPQYSGFETIVHVSTGVVRNLLEPCFWMFHAASSGGTQDKCISPTIQTKILKERSQALWTMINDGLDRKIPDCSESQAKQILNLFEQLADLFRWRLDNHASEPRVLTFSVSGRKGNEDSYAEIMRLLGIARKAAILYYRWGNAKDRGKRETYYVPNRLLWPIRGLDPFGQHGRVSLKVADILAASRGTPFPRDSELQETQDEEGDDEPQFNFF